MPTDAPLTEADAESLDQLPATSSPATLNQGTIRAGDLADRGLTSFLGASQTTPAPSLSADPADKPSPSPSAAAPLPTLPAPPPVAPIPGLSDTPVPAPSDPAADYAAARDAAGASIVSTKQKLAGLGFAPPDDSLVDIGALRAHVTASVNSALADPRANEINGLGPSRYTPDAQAIRDNLLAYQRQAENVIGEHAAAINTLRSSADAMRAAQAAPAPMPSIPGLNDESSAGAAHATQGEPAGAFPGVLAHETGAPAGAMPSIPGLGEAGPSGSSASGTPSGTPSTGATGTATAGAPLSPVPGAQDLSNSQSSPTPIPQIGGLQGFLERTSVTGAHAFEKAAEGLSRFFGLDQFADYLKQRTTAQESALAGNPAVGTSGKLEQWAPQGKAAATTSNVLGGLIGNAPGIVAGGIPGLITLGTQAMAAASAQAHDEAKNAGASDDDATKAAGIAALKTLPSTALYSLAGLGTGKIVSKVVPLEATPFVRAATALVAGTGVNVAAGAAGKAVVGENPTPTIDDLVNSAIFAAHGASTQHQVGKDLGVARSILDGSHPEMAIMDGIAEGRVGEASPDQQTRAAQYANAMRAIAARYIQKQGYAPTLPGGEAAPTAPKPVSGNVVGEDLAPASVGGPFAESGAPGPIQPQTPTAPPPAPVPPAAAPSPVTGGLTLDANGKWVPSTNAVPTPAATPSKEPTSPSNPATAAQPPADPATELAAREKELANLPPSAPPWQASIIAGRIRQLEAIIAQGQEPQTPSPVVPTDGLVSGGKISPGAVAPTGELSSPSSAQNGLPATPQSSAEPGALAGGAAVGEQHPTPNAQRPTSNAPAGAGELTTFDKTNPVETPGVQPPAPEIPGLAPVKPARLPLPAKLSIVRKNTKENPEPARKGSTQVTLPPAAAKPFQDFARSIPDSEIYRDPEKPAEDGRELEPHVTALYGLQGAGDTPGAVGQVASAHGPVTLRLGKLSKFSNPDSPYDVLKVDVESPHLHALNQSLRGLPHQNDYPDYTPHLTIAYMKKGAADQYVGDTRFEGKTVTIPSLTHSSGARVKTELPLSHIDGLDDVPASPLSSAHGQPGTRNAEPGTEPAAGLAAGGGRAGESAGEGGGGGPGAPGDALVHGADAPVSSAGEIAPGGSHGVAAHEPGGESAPIANRDQRIAAALPRQPSPDAIRAQVRAFEGSPAFQELHARGYRFVERRGDTPAFEAAMDGSKALLFNPEVARRWMAIVEADGGDPQAWLMDGVLPHEAFHGRQSAAHPAQFKEFYGKLAKTLGPERLKLTRRVYTGSPSHYSGIAPAVLAAEHERMLWELREHGTLTEEHEGGAAAFRANVAALRKALLAPQSPEVNRSLGAVRRLGVAQAGGDAQQEHRNAAMEETGHVPLAEAVRKFGGLPSEKHPLWKRYGEELSRVREALRARNQREAVHGNAPRLLNRHLFNEHPRDTPDGLATRLGFSDPNAMLAALESELTTGQPHWVNPEANDSRGDEGTAQERPLAGKPGPRIPGLDDVPTSAHPPAMPEDDRAASQSGHPSPSGHEARLPRLSDGDIYAVMEDDFAAVTPKEKQDIDGRNKSAVESLIEKSGYQVHRSKWGTWYITDPRADLTVRVGNHATPASSHSRALVSDDPDENILSDDWLLGITYAFDWFREQDKKAPPQDMLGSGPKETRNAKTSGEPEGRAKGDDRMEKPNVNPESRAPSPGAQDRPLARQPGAPSIPGLSDDLFAGAGGENTATTAHVTNEEAGTLVRMGGQVVAKLRQAKSGYFVPDWNAQGDALASARKAEVNRAAMAYTKQWQAAKVREGTGRKLEGGEVRSQGDLLDATRAEDPLFQTAKGNFNAEGAEAQRGKPDLSRRSSSRPEQGTLLARKPGGENEEPEGAFYSQLTRTIEQLPQETMTVGQARAAIVKGAKPAEIAQQGILDDPLSPLTGKQPNDKVSKADLLGYSLERQAKVQDVTLGASGPKIEKLVNQRDELIEERDRLIDEGNAMAEKEWGDTAAEIQAAQDNHTDQLNALHDLIRELSEEINGIPDSDTHFGQYQLPGADEGSYREQFVTWPAAKDEKVAALKQWQGVKDKLKELDDLGFDNTNEAWRAVVTHADYASRWDVPADATAMFDAYKGRQANGAGWRDGHPQYKDIGNPIVRIRRNLRTDAEGKKTYFLEEMQGPGKSEQEKMPPELRKRIYEIGMKRAIRDAIDEGADAIGWTTGEQQAERYALENQIERVRAFKREDGNYDFMVTPKGETSYKDISDVPEKKLEETVGKELAAKIAEQPARQWSTYEGLDLKVGGEGLKNLYDTMLPRIANKLAEKVGGKVGTGQLVHAEEYGSRTVHRTPIHSMDIPDAWKQKHPQFSLLASKPGRGDSEEPDFASNPGPPPAAGRPIARPNTPLNALYNQAANFVARAKNELKSGAAKDLVAAKYDAANNLANYRGAQAGNSIRLDLPDALDRQAMPFVIEAGGDQSLLRKFKAQIGASSDPKLARKYGPIIQRAIDDFTRLDGLHANHDRMMAENHAKLTAAGIDVPTAENYVTRKLDDPEDMNATLPHPLFEMGTGQGSNPRYFIKGRSFHTLAEAIQAGFPPKSTDLADLDAHRIEGGEKIIEQNKYIEGLKATPAPTDGKPIIGQMETRTPVSGVPEKVVPNGYSAVSVMGKPIVVHNQFADTFRNLFGQSSVRSHIGGRALLKAAAMAKGYTLVFDTFHVGRMLYKQWAGGGGAPVTMKGGKPSWNIQKGLSLLEYADSDLDRAVQQGMITPEEAAYARKNRPVLEELLGAGLNVGKVSDNLVQQAGVHLPIVAGLNDWIFSKLSRGAMLQTSLEAFQRNLASGMSRPRALRQTAKEMNEYFGNLQNQGLFTNKTLQDVSRLVFLAPNWTESQARYEGRAYAQAAKAGYRFAKSGGKERFLGNSARALAVGFVGLLAVNQLLNYLTRKKTTFQNPEEGHQLDAWLPGGKRGFWLDPAEIAAEYFHASEKYFAQNENPVDIASHIASNKLSPIARGAKEALSGRDFSGRHFLNNADRARAAIVDALPSPLPLGAVLEKDPRQPLGYRLNRQPGALLKQLLQSGGVKVTAAQSPRTQMFAIAAPYRADRQGSDAAGEYTELRRALDNDNASAVRSEIQWLLSRGKNMDSIAKAVGWSKNGTTIKPELFAGSEDREAAMLESLSPYEKEVYAQAQRDHLANALKFREYSQGMAPTAPRPQSSSSSGTGGRRSVGAAAGRPAWAKGYVPQ